MTEDAIGRVEVELRHAVTCERKAWESAVFQAAREAGINTERMSAGQVLIVMAATIIELKQKVNSGG